MTGPDLVLVWNGATVGPSGTRGELLPYRPERSCLPTDRDEGEDRRERRRLAFVSAGQRAEAEARAAADPWAPEVRFCCCGCGGALPPRRKKDGRIKKGKRGPGYLRGHYTRVLAAQNRGT